MSLVLERPSFDVDELSRFFRPLYWACSHLEMIKDPDKTAIHNPHLSQVND
jgi:hypothetical protein